MKDITQAGLVHLTTGVVNPSHIEEAYLQDANTSSSCGHYIKVGQTHYNCTTKAGVVVHYASGRTRIYGGDDANALWVGLHGVPAYVDTQDYIILNDGHGLKIKVRGYHDVCGCAYDWVQAPPQLSHDELAEALLRLLWVHNYINTDAIAGINNGIHEAVFVIDGVGIKAQGGPFRDAVLLMPCSYRTDN